jgi:uncharacterized repeat protein (TIGR01451 family)
MRRLAPKPSCPTAWAAVCALAGMATWGCQQFPTLSPTGRVPVVTVPPQSGAPTTPAAGSTGRLVAQPAEVVAPVGTEVVLMASIVRDGFLAAGERVEWTLSRESVGQFAAVGGTDFIDQATAPLDPPRKVSNSFAVGRTSLRETTVTRGTADTSDDFRVQPGQTWVSVTSQREGTSVVTAVAPAISDWTARQQTCVVHWIDVQWALPAPAIVPAGGRQVLTTTVVRQTDRTPLAGWIVRYEVAGGVAAALGAEGTSSVDVPTNQLGQASVEIYQPQPQGGTTDVRIHIVRPAASGGRTITVGNGTTQVTWSASAALRVTGPEQASVGETIRYQLEVRSPSGAALGRATLVAAVPQGIEYLGSTPTASRQGGLLQWPLEGLAAGGQATFEVELRGSRAGTLRFCAALRAADGSEEVQCATTRIAGTAAPQPRDAAVLDVQVAAPREATVGDEVSFVITVTNRGTAAAGGLLATATFDEGLVHEPTQRPGEEPVRRLERDLQQLAPGQSQRFGVTLRATKAGRWCNRVEVTGPGGLRSEATACVAVRAAAEPSRPPDEGTLHVSIRPPQPPPLGQTATWDVDVRNAGTSDLRDLTLVLRIDAGLRPEQATENHQHRPDADGAELRWTIAQLSSGRALRYSVVCRAAQPGRWCVRAEVLHGGPVQARGESCVEVADTRAPLEVAVADTADPISVGAETTYEIRVTNRSTQPDTQLVVEVVLPAEVTPVRLGIRGPTNYELDGRTVRFAPLAEIRAGETVPYRVRVRGVQAGDVTVETMVRSDRSPQAVRATTTTKIFAEPPR